jgi:hypothetical protein
MALIRGVFHENPDTMDFDEFALKANQAIWFLNQSSEILAASLAKLLTSVK